MRRLFALLLALVAATPAAADQLAAGLSTDAIRITSSFRGADLVIFGAVASDARLGDLTKRDIVVVLQGPDVPVIVRRKERVAGLWVNVDEVRIPAMPSYRHIAATRPLNAIGTVAMRIANDILLSGPLTHEPDERMTAAVPAAIRLKTRAQSYRVNEQGVERLGPHLFRARMRLPASVPPGTYRATVYLIDNDTLVARASTTLPIAKAGLERRLADWAENQPLPYALAAVAMALVLGWAGFAAFRRGQ
jgi:uncharacterized protein (TIGR02186 family)